MGIATRKAFDWRKEGLASYSSVRQTAMLSSRFAAVLGLLLLASFGGRSIAGADTADVVNTQVQRKIDVSTQFAKVCNH